MQSRLFGLFAASLQADETDCEGVEVCNGRLYTDFDLLRSIPVSSNIVFAKLLEGGPAMVACDEKFGISATLLDWGNACEMT
jgi:hypothetical protein